MQMSTGTVPCIQDLLFKVRAQGLLDYSTLNSMFIGLNSVCNVAGAAWLGVRPAGR